MLGSVEPLPSSETLGVPDSTVWSAPAFAVGARFASLTLTVTLSVLQSDGEPPSQTFSSKVNAAGPFGALKLGVAVVAPVSVTAVPPVCFHS